MHRIALLTLLGACAPKPDDDAETDAAIAACNMHLDVASCEAEPGCIAEPKGTEYGIVDGACTELATDVAWCIPDQPTGGSASPSLWYETATGRVFGFSLIPPPIDGWELCTCDPPSPPACDCFDTLTTGCSNGVGSSSSG